MIGSSQHLVAKWPDLILQPVLMHDSTYCIKDSFEFAVFIKNCCSQNQFMCSFDICILKTIIICADMLYRCHLTPNDIPEAVFVELRKYTTTSIEFSFNNIMYIQIEGISMGSVLGPTMAGIFVVFHEVELFSRCTVPDEYFLDVDVTFCIFEACKFFSHLNKMHPSLRFTLEKKSNST